MADWREKIDIRDLQIQYGDGKINTRQMAKALAERLKQIEAFKAGDEELQSLVDEFEYCDDDENEFDGIYGDLLKWACKDHRLWISTVLAPNDD